MKKTFVLMTVMVFVFMVSFFVQAVEPSVDSISSASVTNYYQESSLKGEALFDALRERRCAIVVSTTNVDGSPNGAVVIPGVANESTLMFGMAENQTKVNLIERKYAVITAYIYNPDAPEKLKRNVGARIIVSYIADPAEIKRLLKETGAREGTIFVKIEEVLPLG